MNIRTITLGPLGTNCYLVSDGVAPEAIVIDPGDDVRVVMGAAKGDDLAIGKVILTHGHWDHIGAALEVARLTSSPICVHRLDVPLLASPMGNLSSYFADSEQSLESPECLLDDGDVVSVGGLTMKVIHTPGHTPGGLCLLAETTLFSGDSIFRESVGRTDLPGGNSDQLLQSIKHKIMTLPDSVTIYPGHGPSTDVGWEREHNPYLAGW